MGALLEDTVLEARGAPAQLRRREGHRNEPGFPARNIKRHRRGEGGSCPADGTLCAVRRSPPRSRTPTPPPPKGAHLGTSKEAARRERNPHEGVDALTCGGVFPVQMAFKKQGGLGGQVERRDGVGVGTERLEKGMGGGTSARTPSTGRRVLQEATGTPPPGTTSSQGSSEGSTEASEVKQK